jgi:hypothetical protein
VPGIPLSITSLQFLCEVENEIVVVHSRLHGFQYPAVVGQSSTIWYVATEYIEAQDS